MVYLRPVHADLHLPTLYKFIRENPLGVLTTGLKSATYPFLQSTHLPWVLDLPESSKYETSLEGGGVRLRGHLARANPHAKALIEASEGAADVRILEEEVMILFTSPINHYVTPKFYVETKPSTGKVVPTWNYATVQAYGTATVFYDGKLAETGEFLTKQVNDLTRLSEEEVMRFDGNEGRKGAWTVSEAPESYVALLKKSIIGLEIEVTRLAGKWKMSQELPDGDRKGTVEGFESLGTAEGQKIAEIIKERGELKNGRKNAI